jgi:hypothetical protein
MTGTARFVMRNVARGRFHAALRRKIAGPFREHLATKKKQAAALQPRALTAIVATAGLQEGKR